jgi:hypothetical protein
MADLRLLDTTILDIVCFCDVLTLKNLRLSGSSMRELVNTYQVSICSRITNHIFSSDEIRSFGPFIREADSTPLRILFALDYRVEAAKWLAAVGAEYAREEEDPDRLPYRNYGANDPQGDHIRSMLMDGWSVIWHLSDIAHKVVSEQLGNSPPLLKKRISVLTRGLTSAQKIEYAIQQGQLAYAQTISWQEQLGYHLTTLYLRNVFADRVFGDPQGKTSPNWRTGNSFGERDSWLKWLVLREGPWFFVRAWSSREGNRECLGLIQAEWAKRSRKQILLEKYSTREVNSVLESVHKIPREKLWDLMEGVENDHRTNRVFEDVHFFLGRRLPKDIISSIEKEYSDYSS